MNLDGSKKTHLLVIDPNPLLREGLKRVLELNDELEVIAEGDRGEQLLPLYKEYLPDAILFDTNLPGTDGLEALQELTMHFPDAKVLVFTVIDEFSHVSQAIKAGAVGYLLKEMDANAIINAIKSVVRGGIYLHPQITKDLLFEFKKLNGIENNGNYYQLYVRPPYHLLTPQECHILQMLSEGYSNKALAKTIEISDKTVKNHVSSILKKLKLTDRTQAVVTALKNGWIELR